MIDLVEVARIILSIMAVFGYVLGLALGSVLVIRKLCNYEKQQDERDKD